MWLARTRPSVVYCGLVLLVEGLDVGVGHLHPLAHLVDLDQRVAHLALLADAVGLLVGVEARLDLGRGDRDLAAEAVGGEVDQFQLHLLVAAPVLGGDVGIGNRQPAGDRGAELFLQDGVAHARACRRPGRPWAGIGWRRGWPDRVHHRGCREVEHQALHAALGEVAECAAELAVAVLGEFGELDVARGVVEHHRRGHRRDVHFIAPDAQVDELLVAGASERDLHSRPRGPLSCPTVCSLVQPLVLSRSSWRCRQHRPAQSDSRTRVSSRRRRPRRRHR